MDCPYFTRKALPGGGLRVRSARTDTLGAGALEVHAALAAGERGALGSARLRQLFPGDFARALQIGVAQIRGKQVGFAEPRRTEQGLAELGTVQHGLPEIAPGKRRPAEAGSAAIGLVKLRAGELGVAEF